MVPFPVEAFEEAPVAPTSVTVHLEALLITEILADLVATVVVCTETPRSYLCLTLYPLYLTNCFHLLSFKKND